MDRGFRIGTGLVAAVIPVLVTGIAVVLVHESWLSIRTFGLGFWTTSTWDPVAGDFGAVPFLWGTLYSSFLALLLSTPVAIGIAVFLSEMAPSALRQPLVFLTDLLAAIPSIIYGLWGIFILVPLVRTFQTSLPDWLRKTPLFTGPPVGVGMLAAALVLAVMVLPYTASVAREVLRAVPPSQREAALALGATRWESIQVALYYGRTGVLGAILLGLGRALGETMAVTMVIGNTPKAALSLFAPQYTMAAVIANEFTEAADQLYLDSLVAIGLVLFIVTFAINALSRFLIWRVGSERPAKRRAQPVAAAPAAPAATGA
ncbi:MAG TPA: phosphate ABC transporter permease subunit PstC [Candidatus Polarisedimenticolia bacterium]|nr:phosphate ABC transporter permease subunit PstC [Candidatus Polarisedimenticolia bacterium]